MISDVLVVDDEADIRELVAAVLQDEGYAVRTAANAEAALISIRTRKPALVVLDIWMTGGGMDGLGLLDVLTGLDHDLPVIMISGHGNIETAVSAIKRGAYDFLEKPFKSDRLLLVVQRALEASALRRENRRLRTQAIVPDGLVGASAASQQLRAMIAKEAPANSRVLISGPPGSGKETSARLIHAASPRARAEFVAVSAAGMTPQRMDVELFAVSHAVTMLRAKKPGIVLADLLETPDNSPCRDVFARAGFVAEDGVFALPAEAMPVTPAHVRLL